MQAPRVAHGLFTWQDGREALEACLRSTAPYVDEIIIADGLIDGVDPNGLPTLSDLRWLAQADWLPDRVPVSAKRWRSLSACCSWILAQARALDCDWLLYVDGDQELHRGENLRDRLPAYERALAFPLIRDDGTIVRYCPWQLVNVHRIHRYLAGCFVIEGKDGYTYSLVPGGDTRILGGDPFEPWLSHHPERRSQARQQHRLGELETTLEPPPLDAISVKLPYLLPMATEKEDKGAKYYCPACGRRYDSVGTCTEGHPSEPTPLESLKASSAKSDSDK